MYKTHPNTTLFPCSRRKERARISLYVVITSIWTTLLVLSYFFDKQRKKDKDNASHQYTLVDTTPSSKYLPFNGNSEGVSTWTQLYPPPPIGMQEGTGALVETARGQEVWFMGGYPIDKGHVTIYNIETKQWREGPYLPWGLHHVFSAVFSSKGQLIVLGGIIHENERHYGNNAALLRGIGDDFSVPWRRVELPVGGIITCTSLHVDGTYWCYSGDIGDYGDIPFSFFEFRPETLEIRQLPIPPLNSTHVAFLQDFERGLIYMAAGRGNNKRKAPPPDKLFIYDIEHSKWLEEVITIPFSPMESRSAIQRKGVDFGLLMGGQTSQGQQISDLILQFHFNTRKFVWVDELPMQMFGFSIVPLPNGNYILYGGASGYGARFHRLAWEWDPGRLLQEKQPDRYFGRDIEVVHAVCGSIIVTEFLKMKVAAGNTSVPAKWCLEEEALGQGGPWMTLTLTVHFLRDGKMHWLVCDDSNECKLRP